MQFFYNDGYMNPHSPRGERARRTALLEVYDRLYRRYGPQHWWPGETPFEVIIGAILTQSAAWANVEKAIASLKSAGALDAARLRGISHQELARLVYPSGYFNAKARKIKAFVEHLGEWYADDLSRLFAQDAASLRRELLGIHGIGPETADSIVLYAAGKPSFVIDAYTRRVLRRLGLGPRGDSYDDFQQYFEARLPRDAQLYNEYHALLVRLGKEVCRKRSPLCGECCLREVCRTGRAGLPSS